MKPLQSQSLREQAVELLHASIVAGELRPGELYSASGLAAKLAVSQTPVREALLELANAGLVEAVRNRGFRVTEPDERDLDEVGELRLMLEVPAVPRVVATATDEQLEAFSSIVDELEDCAATGNLPGYVLADRKFHLGLLELTGNRRLVRMVAQLRDQTRLVGLRELADSGTLMATSGEHRQILDAIVARDPDRAEALMRSHIEHTRGIWAGRTEPGAPTGSTIADR